MTNKVSTTRTADFQLVGDADDQQRLSHYTRSQFTFIGVRAPERRAQAHAMVRDSRQWPVSDVLAGIAELYERSEREYQYVAVDLAIANVQRFDIDDVRTLSHWVTVRPARDTVDLWRRFFGLYVQHHLDEKPIVFALFYKHDNVWMRRIAILLQLPEDYTLDADMLTAAIIYDRATPDPQIQKAIGWALRSYGKYDAAWVRGFLRSHGLSQIASTEAHKHLLDL
ncbi:DNA alkylation repair protein [Lacticaseibacillus thailandensis]|nr:DNA alkylation repair protein [Lacticaseibacillus thailandensis]